MPSNTIQQGFTVGSGVAPESLRVSILLIASGVTLTVCAWLILQLFKAYKDEQIGITEAIWGALKVTIVLGFLFSTIFR